MAVDERDFGLLQKLRKLPQPVESMEVFVVPDLLSVDMRLMLAALPLLPGRMIPRAPAGALATHVAELGKVTSVVPVLSRWLRKEVGTGGKGNTDEDERLLLPVGMVQPAKPAPSTPSSGSLSLDTAMLSLLGFFLAFRLSDPQLLTGALMLPVARKLGGD